jgi:hypothetical protein
MGSDMGDTLRSDEPIDPPAIRLPRPRVGGLPADEESSLITPFTVIPRLLARSTAGQVTWNVALFVTLPTVLFLNFIIINNSTTLPTQYAELRLALPLAAVWVVASPLLMYSGERAGARWVASLAADADFGWNVERVRAWKRRIDRFYYPTALIGAAAAVAALALALPNIRDVLPVPAVWGTAVQYFVFAQAGFTAMGGLHGVVRWIVVTRAAVSGTTLRWHPFRMPEHGSLARSYQLSLLLGIGFSSGAFFVPALLAVIPSLDIAAQYVLWGFIILLLMGGVLIFVVPMVTLVTALSKGKNLFLANLETPLSQLLDEIVRSVVSTDLAGLQRAHATERLMTIRAGVAAIRLIPAGQTIGRTLLTVVIPVISLILSVLQTNVLST